MNQVASRQLSKDMPQEPPILISSTSPLPSTSVVATKSFQWPTSASQYEQGVLIGKGTFSTVYTGICKSYPKQPQKICIKIMDLENIIISFEEILQEISMMRLCDDPNILTCFTNFVVKDQLWLILQLMNKGSALRVMSISKLLGYGEGLSEDCLAYIIAETLKGINYLHSRSLIHRDIKSGNILLDSNGIVKLSDLAFSGWTVEIGTKIKSRTKTLIGTPCFIAPEVLLLQQQPSPSQKSPSMLANISQSSNQNLLTSNKSSLTVETTNTIPSSSSSDHLNSSSSKDNLNASNHGNESSRPMAASSSTNNNNAFFGGAATAGGYDNRADIWSLGITCLELAKGYPPYANLNSTMAIVKVTIDGDPPSLKSYPHDKQLNAEGQPFSKNYDDFIKKCLQKNPKYRPSASELLKHRFVRTNSNSSESLIKFLTMIPDVDDIQHMINQKFSSFSNSINNDLYNELENIIGENNEFTETFSYSTEPTPVIVNRTPGQYFTSSSIASSPAHLSSSSTSHFQSSTSSPDYSKTPSRNNSYRTIRTFSSDSNPPFPLASLSGKLLKEGNGSDKLKSTENNNNNNRSRNNSWAFQFPETELAEEEDDDDNYRGGIAQVDDNSRDFDDLNISHTHSADIPIPLASSSPTGQTRQQSDSLDKDETRSSTSYVPGTTWVFDTKDLREGKAGTGGEDGKSKNNSNSNSSNMKTINEDQEHDRDGIEDFLNEFEMDEATLR
jgi:serine/threonine protein kinase